MRITDALRAEHTIFLTVFDQIEHALPSLRSPAECRTMARIIEGILRDHAGRETDLAFLALDHVLAEKGHVDRMHHEHREIDARLKEALKARTCAESKRLLRAGIGAAREHFRIEEKVLFPLLEETLKPGTLERLGSEWSSANGGHARHAAPA